MYDPAETDNSHAKPAPSLIAKLVQEHAVIETALDQFAQTVASGRIDAGMVQHVGALLGGHYLREETFLVRLQAHERGLAAKLKAQHEEALEIAARLVESVAAGEIADINYLARRLLAIAQHNIIEEERDVFPLARASFSVEEDEP